MSNRVQKWNVGLERRKERETVCGRLRKRTPFLRLRAQLQQDVRKGVQKFSKLLRIDADTKTGFNQNPVFVYSILTYKLILIF